MPERKEYRVVGERRGRQVTLISSQAHLDNAVEDMADFQAPDSPYTNVRIQWSKTVQTPWVDLPESKQAGEE